MKGEGMSGTQGHGVTRDMRINYMLAGWLTALLLMCMMPVASAQDAAGAKHADILRLMKLTNEEASFRKMYQMMFEETEKSMRAGEGGAGAGPTAKPLVQDYRTAAERVLERRLPELMEILVALYDRHYSHDDIRGLITFFSSPLGRKLVENSPELMRESYSLGVAFGKSISEEIWVEIMYIQRGKQGATREDLPNLSFRESVNAIEGRRWQQCLSEYRRQTRN
jgi:hypothetical protein